MTEPTPDQILALANTEDPMSLAPLAYSQLDPFYNREVAKPGSTSKVSQFADQLQALALRLLRMSVYLEARAYYDMDHTHAVKEQNKVITKVRRALGFSYPDRGQINF